MLKKGKGWKFYKIFLCCHLLLRPNPPNWRDTQKIIFKLDDLRKGLPPNQDVKNTAQEFRFFSVLGVVLEDYEGAIG